jgi:small-conductance mechanosensitive channel
VGRRFPLDASGFAPDSARVIFSRHRSWLRGTAAAACGLLLAMVQPTPAQLPSLAPAAKEKEAAPEKPEDTRKRLEQWQHEARDMLAKLNAENGNATLPAGITSAEVEARRRDLEQMLLTTTGFIKILSASSEVRLALEKARAEGAAWTGFKETPPFSVLMLDELQNERDSIQARFRSHESSQANLQGLLTSILGETKAADAAVSSAMQAVQNAASGQEEVAKWRLEATRAKARLMATRAAYLQASIENLKERIAIAKAELDLIDRKIAIASKQVVFSDEDMAKIEKVASDRRKSIDKEIAGVAARLRTAITARNRAQSELDAVAAKPDGSADEDALSLARFRLEVAEGRVESLQSIIEVLDGLVQLEELSLKAYNDRRTLLVSKDEAQHDQALASLDSLAERLRIWVSVINNERTACAADLSKIEARATVVSADDPRFELLNQQRASRSEKLAMLERAHQTVGVQRRFVRRWIAEHSPDAQKLGFSERLGAFSSDAWTKIQKVWSWQVMSYEDKLEVDGQTITGKVPVTLGMLLHALLFFIIGYWIASRLANRVQQTIVARGHIAEAQAKTLRNWAMIVVGVALALGTLSFLKIPLTVFAFFGGALAIGLGFGMQTLIKNFISGIIVLAERKVRVGDILDVDGIVGTVVEVNTRSSIIRSPDEVETMIPNSLFLENRVTNWTLSDAHMRRSLRVGVAYGTSPQAVIDVLKDCADRHGLVSKHPAPFVIFEDFGESALVFVLYFWVNLRGPANAMVVASDLRLMIEKHFAEAGISFPFPQRDLHLAASSPIRVSIASES